ncbi:IS256 family transposase [Zhouia amylolytica]|uniref:Mutator family transposase n=1 Tax=Zhouia amylolytica AD3 TaxID=1286632 RepID=W2USJ5_9FLAO|nr:IS256 family transposase [Zhouia amylolytica]ETN96446.1 transposase mutator type [Zhouia amylolytica AD3]
MITMSAKNKFNKEELEQLFEGALEQLKSTKKLEGSDGAFTPLLKKLLEASMEGEMDAHLKDSRPNRRNGKGSKKVKTSFGEVPLEPPRDRDGTYEPEILPKRQRSLGPALEQKILSLYSMGMSYRDIASHIKEMYDMELSPAQLTAITDRIWPEIEEWRSRPLDQVYPFVWLDALFYKVRQDGQIKSMAAYLVLGMNVEGEKDLLGIYLSQSESATFWLSVLSDLQARGVEDILIASIDNLKGFREAIQAVFPATDIQLCIVHQIRNAIRYVPFTDSREVVRDMKSIYKANTLEQAELALENFEDKWKKKYPAMVRSWKNNWEGLSTFFNYHPEIRNIMYTTNSIEGFNRQIRKATKTKGALPSERALLKLLYLVSIRTTRKWSRPRSWTKVINILIITYPERLGIT